MEFPSQVVSKTYSILFSAKFGPFSNPFRGRASAVRDEREQWNCSRNVLCSKPWNPPRIEVETLWVLTWEKHIIFGNRFDCVEGVIFGKKLWKTFDGILKVAILTVKSPFPETTWFILSNFWYCKLLCFKCLDYWLILNLSIRNMLILFHYS